MEDKGLSKLNNNMSNYSSSTNNNNIPHNNINKGSNNTNSTSPTNTTTSLTTTSTIDNNSTYNSNSKLKPKLRKNSCKDTLSPVSLIHSTYEKYSDQNKGNLNSNNNTDNSSNNNNNNNIDTVVSFTPESLSHPKDLSSSASPQEENKIKSKKSQACDRCRSKKIRCDAKKPQCSACANVGFECKITDKLLRKTFPRGYTESLEERIRELEAENRKLNAICDIKEQKINQLEKTNSPNETIFNHHMSTSTIPLDIHKINHLEQSNNINNTNNTHICDGDCLHKNLHPKPVATSFNLNDPTSISFEQEEAPGLAAAKVINSIKNHEESAQLATLVSLSVPRSTEEILFVPQLLSKIRQVYGFTSKQCLYTVSLLSSLKDDLPPPNLTNNSNLILNNTKNFEIISNTNLWQINDIPNFLLSILKFNILPHDNNSNNKKDNFHQDKADITLNFQEIDELVKLFFKYWSHLIPILIEEEFLKYFERFKNDIKNFSTLVSSSSSSPKKIKTLLNIKYFACLLTVICQMGILVKYKNFDDRSPKSIKLISYYHQLMYVLPRNSFFSVTTTSIRTLQFLCLILYYHLNTGDIIQIYGLRGTIVSMSQQLRLHRCPSAVLTGSGNKMNKLEQSNRRRLFWCTYYLDVFASLQLGVPRLIKDHEIECALPQVKSEEHSTNDIKLEGLMSNFSLAIIRFAKVLGNVLDSVFKRNMSEYISKQVAEIHENALDNWRRGLPKAYQFNIKIDGKIELGDRKKEKYILATLYFLAKCMIQLPISSPLVPIPGKKEQPRTLPSHISLQYSANALLTNVQFLNDTYLTLPINTSRTLARFALISAKGSLEYDKSGPIFAENKNLLLDIVNVIESNRKIELPGVVSWYSLKMLDLTICLFLKGSSLKGNKLEKFLQKKLQYYNTAMGIPFVEKRNSAPKRKVDYYSPNQKTQFDRKKLRRQDEISKENNMEEYYKKANESQNLNNPSIPQTEFATALQLDPILNSSADRFSNTDLLSFFSSQAMSNGLATNENNKHPNFNKETISKKTGVNSLMDNNMETLNFDNNMIRRQVSTNYLNPSYKNNSYASMMMFLNNDIPTTAFSLDSIYNSDSVQNKNRQGSKASSDSYDNANIAKGNSIIDASLGLVPLLSDTNYTLDTAILSPDLANFDFNSSKAPPFVNPDSKFMAPICNPDSISKDHIKQEFDYKVDGSQITQNCNIIKSPEELESNINEGLFNWQNSNN